MSASGLSSRRGLGLEARFPGMRAAFDPNAMADLLQRSVIGGSDLAIERCTPGKAYVEHDLCQLRYSLELRGSSGGNERAAVFTGRLFADSNSCLRFFSERVVPLADRLHDREELAGFQSPIAVFEDLFLVVYAFPIDPDLPFLIEATEPSHMKRILGRLVPGSLAPSLEVEACRVAVAHYPRRHRCVLRYEVDGRMGSEDASVVVFGKITPDEAPAESEVVEQLARTLGAGRDQVRVPRHVGYVSELGLVLIEGIPGRPEIASLIKAVAAGADGDQGGSLRRAVEVSGRVAASVHCSRAHSVRKRPLTQELSELQKEIEELGRVLPQEVAPLDGILSEVTSVAEGSEGYPMQFSHGDFTPSQILFDGPEVGLIDFDNLCLAEPALDLGQFCAYMTAAVVKAGLSGGEDGDGLGSQLRRRFLESYAQAAGLTEMNPLSERLHIYECLSLLRMSVRARRQLKLARSGVALAALQQIGGTNGGRRRSGEWGPPL